MYLLLDLLFLDELRVGVLQLVVQSAVLICTRLPYGALSTTFTQQSLKVTITVTRAPRRGIQEDPKRIQLRSCGALKVLLDLSLG